LLASSLGFGFSRSGEGQVNVKTGLAAYAISAGIFLAVYVTTDSPHGLFAGDGHWYASIATEGYESGGGSHVLSRLAFFPATPLFGRAVSTITGVGPLTALALVANVALLLALILFAAYSRASGGSYPVLALALTPCACFFHFAYSESLFLCLAVLAFLAMQRRWSPVLTAIIIGAATGARPVGVALLLPWIYHLRYVRGESLLRAGLLSLLACWGLIAYMGYQYFAFGDPLIFAETQASFSVRTRHSLADKITSLLSGEPIWGVYIYGCPGFWRWTCLDLDAPSQFPAFNLQFLNPIFWCGTFALVIIGARKRWLTIEESLLSFGLLLIPYVTKGYEFAMVSQGRFAVVVFPAYVVAGRLLSKLPKWLAWLILGFLAIYFAVLVWQYLAWRQEFL
jgi:hypothetical protein